MTNSNWPEKAKIRLTGSYWTGPNDEGRTTDVVYDAEFSWATDTGTEAWYIMPAGDGGMVSAAVLGGGPYLLSDEAARFAGEFATGPEAHPAGRDL